ncbi:ImmA/IrrE family metallo-endopeptidase [Akkermansia muciniphila]|uniref:ImmA/IrrE family metallo-endopeptidase n=1 Tax=Akkermansia muciniphila TaxID=239935 RepID=UPI00122F815B|nr:ImmA/IrrE family metallo-endopeptidase [Akkermansia muciniphila]
MKILGRAQKIVQKYGTNDPKTILNMMNVIVVPCQLYGLRGIYKRIERNNFVFIDDSLDGLEETFVLGHELAHHVLHRGINRMFLEQCTYLKTSPYENDADLFSVCLMAPYPTDIITCDSTIESVSKQIGVNHQLSQMYLFEVAKLYES